MKTVALIQARMGSTRLPGKVLADLFGRSMLAWVVRRLTRARTLDLVAVATTTTTPDDAVVSEAEALGVDVLRGSEDDVLDRYYQAARRLSADAIVRITADCPLVDPAIVDLVVQEFHEGLPDYASNTLERTYPRGLDVEVVRSDALAEAWRDAAEPFERAHVTPFIYRHAERFRLRSVRSAVRADHLRWTVDTPDDLAVVRAIIEDLGGRDDFGWMEAFRLVQSAPERFSANRGTLQKRLEQG